MQAVCSWLEKSARNSLSLKRLNDRAIATNGGWWTSTPISEIIIVRKACWEKADDRSGWVTGPSSDLLLISYPRLLMT